ncbi:MAG: hypothetical protein WD231_04965 [Candidatus Woykebacteria bacterium]
MCAGEQGKNERSEGKMSRKEWYLVTWDVPTFDGSPGKLVYTQAVKARHPQIALWKASRGFIEKMKWALDNKWKSIGGRETEARLLSGVMAGNPSLERGRALFWEQVEGARFFSRPLHENMSHLGGLKLGERVQFDSTLQGRLEELACGHKKFYRALDVRSRSATLKTEVCKDCGLRRVVGWYQEGENWP